MSTWKRHPEIRYEFNVKPVKNHFRIFLQVYLQVMMKKSCQCSHDKSKWNSDMGALVLKAPVSPMFSLQEGDE
jgi:hypothetical protein